MDEKTKVRKINEYSYSVDKTGNMKVPVKIFASEKLMEKITEDRCLQQGINVATLPGIKGASLMMPDAHQGYGFPIGGVAAIDCKDGCISPGGIGFDINCLPGNSEILTNNRYFRKIEDFENQFTEITLRETKLLKSQESLISLKNKKLQENLPVFFMKKKNDKKMFKITSELGFSVRLTEDHPILTQKGMKKPEELTKNDFLSVNPFKGILHESWEEKELVPESYFDVFDVQQANFLKKQGLLPLKSSNPKIAVFARLFGFLIGDGNIHFSYKKGKINAYGDEYDLRQIQSDFKELGFSSKIYSRKRNHSIKTKYDLVEFTAVNSELHVTSSSLANLFLALDYPYGNKTNSNYELPKWILNAPKWIKSNFLAGFFGAELSKPRTHTKTGFDCPTISMNKNIEFTDSGRKFLIQIMKILDEFGIESHELNEREDYVNKNGKTIRLKLIISSKEDNLLRLWEKIGFAYNEKRDILSKIAIFYILKKKKTTLYRKNLAIKIKNLKSKGLSLRDVQVYFENENVNSRFIERHYYENANHRINLDFPSFKKYAEEMQKVYYSLGYLPDKISKIEEINYSDYVYDFSMSENHNFIADNIIVSNCGVRLLTTNLTKQEVYPKIQELLNELFKEIPPGLGGKSLFRLEDDELKDVLTRGPIWAVEKGYGTKEDLENCESNGFMPGANPEKVSQKAKSRGRAQLGTLGSGNHFLEIQYVKKIFDKNIAKKFGITKEEQVVVLIHCGSRGLGHQVCSDYLRKMEDAFPEIVESLPEKNLIYAPTGTELAKDYFAAMCAAANFAWTNRHIIGHQTRKSFKAVFGDAVSLNTVYDVAHNIAKLEEHMVDGKKEKVYVHRKGATRAFPPGNPEIPKKYQKTGQPIFIPGSMGTSSYVLVGTKKAMEESFGSTAHGAGRMMSRHKANQEYKGETLKEQLEKENIYVKAASLRGISEEAPNAYKDVDEVVKVSDDAGIGKIVAQLKPIGVIKG